ncbi:DUF3717 domain-containing protein [Cupriavidus gilardii]|nr:DUF3717 domain-containing protein [Cupriavidus gilardii]
MMTGVPISLIEKAINEWRERRPTSKTNGTELCKEVRALADLYGVMIYERVEVIAYGALTDNQKRALDLVVGGGV